LAFSESLQPLPPPVRRFFLIDAVKALGCLLIVWAVNSVIGRSNLFMGKSGKKISHICQRASQP
jgi:hypothetical protein